MVTKEKGRSQGTEGTQETPCGVLEISHGVSVRAWARKDRNGELGILEQTQTLESWGYLTHPSSEHAKRINKNCQSVNRKGWGLVDESAGVQVGRNVQIDNFVLCSGLGAMGLYALL